MAWLRDREHGCPWDIEQTFRTIAPYTIEEAYEVADAIERDDLPALKEELGDLLLQVVYHAQMATEANAFSFDDVAAAIADKMVDRHPHVFGDLNIADADAQTVSWEARKAAERARKGQQQATTSAAGALDGVALALPALLRAEKLQKRAARVGFDWGDFAGPADKVREELEELAEAGSDAERFAEAGDLLFAAVNAVRSLRIPPEEALRAANTKFERRFKGMEAIAEAEGEVFAELPLGRQEALWQQVKAGERK